MPEHTYVVFEDDDVLYVASEYDDVLYVVSENEGVLYVVSENEGLQGAIGPPGVNIYVGPSAPSNPQVDMWVDTDEPTPLQVTVSTDPPANPTVGDLWVQI